MPKAKITLKNRIETRLSQEDYDRFNALAKAKNLNIGQLSREAILFYLNSPKIHKTATPEAPTIAQMRNTTDRICAMLFRLHKDISTLYTLTWDAYEKGDQHIATADTFKAAVAKSKKRISRPLDPDEKREGANYKESLLES